MTNSEKFISYLVNCPDIPNLHSEDLMDWNFMKPFVKWLVKNDKIEWKTFWELETISSKYSDFELSYDTPQEDYVNLLLMELSLQENPIRFLISILS